jgi:hypothetical protein
MQLAGSDRILSLILTKKTCQHNDQQGLGIRVSIPGRSVGFSLRHRAQTGSGAHPAFYPVDMGYSSLGVKQPENEADHSAPFSVDVKNACCCTSFFHK